MKNLEKNWKANIADGKLPFYEELIDKATSLTKKINHIT